jgi:transcriptional regulator with XRE-family HTH domain
VDGGAVTAVVKVDVPALYDALDRARQQHGLSWRQLAAKTGVGPSTFTRMSGQSADRQVASLDAATFATFVTWLRMPLESFIEGEFPDEVDEVTELRARVTQLEHDYAQTHDERLAAQRKMVSAQKNSQKAKVQADGWERSAQAYSAQLAIARQQLVDNGIEPDRRIT